MTRERYRRDILQVGVGIGSLAFSGCLSKTGDDLIIKNHSTESHSVTVVFNRGEADELVSKTVMLEPDSRETFSEFIPASDYDYLFSLVVYVDGSPIETMELQWNGEVIVVTIESSDTATVTTRRTT